MTKRKKTPWAIGAEFRTARQNKVTIRISLFSTLRRDDVRSFFSNPHNTFATYSWICFFCHLHRMTKNNVLQTSISSPHLDHTQWILYYTLAQSYNNTVCNKYDIINLQFSSNVQTLTKQLYTHEDGDIRGQSDGEKKT